MNRSFAVLLALAIAGPAAAQSSAGSSSRANQSVRSQNGAAAIVYNGGGGGGGTTTIRNTPDAFAPSIMGGAECSGGVSAGVSLPGVGFTGGISTTEKACELRQGAALLFNMGFEREAVAMLCAGDRAFFAAFAATGRCRGRK